MSTLYIEWFTEETYSAVKAFMLPDPDIPGAYNAWLFLKKKQMADLLSRGDIAEKVEVNPQEFRRYCDHMGYKYDTVALHRFVTWKGIGQSF